MDVNITQCKACGQTMFGTKQQHEHYNIPDSMFVLTPRDPITKARLYKFVGSAYSTNGSISGTVPVCPALP